MVIKRWQTLLSGCPQERLGEDICDKLQCRAICEVARKPSLVRDSWWPGAGSNRRPSDSQIWLQPVADQTVDRSGRVYTVNDSREVPFEVRSGLVSRSQVSTRVQSVPAEGSGCSNPLVADRTRVGPSPR
jgi:hypothetical protein